MLALFVCLGIILDVYNARGRVVPYVLTSTAEKLLDTPQTNLADELKLAGDGQSYEYNQGYSGSGTDLAGESMSPRFTASYPVDPSKGSTITDASIGVSITIKPKFGLYQPQKQQNRLVYPLKGYDGQRVETMHVSSTKEDIILNSEPGKTAKFEYELSLPDGTEARLEPDGSVSIYGADRSLIGSVQTGSKQDEELLKKARDRAEKNNLLFRFPAPFIRDSSRQQSKSRAWYGLKGTTLTLYAGDLDKATYPLSIDPTIYIDSATRLMRGNNESNIDFDVDNELIQKGKTTGGRFDTWNSSMALPTTLWRHQTVMYGGYIYVVGGYNGSAVSSTLYWAHVNSSTGELESTNPGGGACSTWCTDSAYNLPAARQSGAFVAYNGYLFMLGGNNGTTSQSTIYVAKLGANGEPQLWRPTDNDPNTYWYASSMNLPSAMSFLGATVYNNRIYIAGGINSVQPSATGSLNVYMADILPTGKLYGSNASTWFSLTSLAASNERHSVGLQVYNDRLYIIGGAKATTTQSTVFYNKIASDGTLSATWSSTTAISTTNGTVLRPRSSMGGTFTTMWGGFIYVVAGCSTLNASGYCTSMANDVMLASVNADGTITDWTTMNLTSGSPNTNIGYGLAAWRNRLYSIGGCAAQNTTTGACTTLVSADLYGSINQDGDVSTVSTSSPNGTAPCASATWTDCDLPPEGDGNGQSGRMAGGAIVNNGYIYYMGGCTAVSSGSVCYSGNAGKAADNISYASIASDGNITRIPTCTSGTFVGSWCVNNTNVMGNKLAAFSYALYNNTLYVIGGTTGTEWQDDVWRVSFNSDGTWGTWTSQTFGAVGLGNARGYTYAFTRANPGSASTYPANLYVLGGCSGVTALDSGLDCSGALYTEVYKCFIKTDGSIETTGSACTTSGQMQIDSEPNTGGNQGLGVMAGTVYANYVYMIGGQSPNESERGEVIYAKIDNSNNIVAASGSTWIMSPNEINPIRRRGMAFGYNGYLYALAGYNAAGGGSLNDLLYAKIDVSDGSIGAFSTSTVTVTARWDLRGVVNNGYVYAVGGCSSGAPPASCATMTGTVQTFQLYNNYSGSPKLYSAGSQYATDRYGAGAAVLNGYIYLAGGCTSTTDCSAVTNSVQYAPLNADGSVGTWQAGGNLPASLSWGRLLSAGNTLYFLGGQNSAGTAQSTVYYTSSISNGNPTWNGSAASGGIGDTSSQAAQARTKFGAASWNNRLYVIAGVDGSSNRTNTVYISPALSSGGNIAADSWVADVDTLNVARSGNAVVAYANNLYSFGGYNGSQYLNDSQYTQINSDGTIDAWSYTTSLPAVLDGATGFAANGFMYLFGGRSDATTCRSNTIVAPISANTTIASGNNPTGTGEWYATNIKYSGDRYGAAAIYDQGRTYVMGGMCNGTIVTTTNRVQTSTLQSQPQIARYSRMIDTDKDVFPSVWLMNGLDNSTGARWYMKYRSMTDPQAVPWDGSGNNGTNCSQQQMSTWGQETNFGEVALGKVEQYISLDANGNVTNGGGSGGGCARYYYLNVTIDSQQSYGYPEDVTRGPTIADLSLYFTASPGQRLLHGKTFNAGEQQPLDTPCSKSNNINGSTYDPLYAACPNP